MPLSPCLLRQGTKWLINSAVPPQLVLPASAKSTLFLSINAEFTLYFHTELQGRLGFQGYRNLTPYDFLSEYMSAY